MRISACVDCATTIIGERQRCPACHDQHAVEVAAFAPVVSPRRCSPAFNPSLLSWVVGAEIFVIVVGGFMLAMRGCP